MASAPGVVEAGGVELSPPESAYTFVRGLALAHLDAVVPDRTDAAEFLGGDVATALATRAVVATVFEQPPV